MNWERRRGLEGDWEIVMVVDERLIADFANLEPVYVDGTAGVINLGTNFAMLFYRFAPLVDGRFGKTPALMVVKPRSSLICANPNCAFAKIIDAQAAPETSGLLHRLGIH